MYENLWFSWKGIVKALTDLQGATLYDCCSCWVFDWKGCRNCCVDVDEEEKEDFSATAEECS